MKKIAVLGCTGSIGKSTLEIIRQNPNKFSAAFLVANKSRTEAAALAAEFQCPFALVSEESDCISRLLPQTKPDIAVNGIAGSAGLLPSKLVLEAGCDLALANKETVVMAWDLIKALAQKNHAQIIPVDSEHSAIFNLTQKIGAENIDEILITASGGPFRNYEKNQLESVTVEDALKHPTWNMGAKITIDSATLANKGLEVIEAARLFGFAADRIKVVVHPESIVHSLVRTKDGMLYAQLSEPDMKHPILGALTWPNYEKNDFMEKFELFGKTLSFFAPDSQKFPMLSLAYDAVQKSGGYTIAYNAANEVAVDAFINRRISFTDIWKITEKTLAQNWDAKLETFDEVFKTDAAARIAATEILEKLKDNKK